MDVEPRTVIISSKLSIMKLDFYSFLESQKIERIVLKCDYRILDYSKLPICVYYIECDIGCGSIDISILPSSITNLSVSNPLQCNDFNINKLPSNLKYLLIGFEIYNNAWKDVDLLNLPPNLEELILHGKFNLPLDNLPFGLKKLIIKSKNFNFPLDNLPASLEYLEIYNESSEFKSISFPENLITLIIKSKKNITNGNITLSKLPRTIKYLTLDSNSYSDIEIDEFPENLEILDITTNLHNLAMDILPKLPKNLKAIKLGRGKIENYNYITNKYPNIIIIL